MVKFFDRGYILRFLLTIMLVCLCIPCEILAVFFLKDYMSVYLLVAVAAGMSLLLLPVAYAHITHYIKRIRMLIHSGEYPDNDFLLFAGAIIGSVLVVIPGYLTTLIGLVLFFAGPKKLAGLVVCRIYRGFNKDLYEYLKLYPL